MSQRLGVCSNINEARGFCLLKISFNDEGHLEVSDFNVKLIPTSAVPPELCIEQDGFSFIAEGTFIKVLTNYINVFHHYHPVLIWFYPRKWGWPDLPHPNSNLSNSHYPSHSIQGILLLQTNTLALLLHLCLPHLLWSSLLALALHFKLQCFSQTCPSSLLNTCPYHLSPFAFAI